MRATLKEMYSIELPGKLEEYLPAHPENVGLSIRLIVGPEGNDSGESFDLLVCTPDWINEQFTQVSSIWGRHMLIVPRYDHALIRQKISHQVSTCQGEDWGAIASKLARFAAWGFEDYRPAFVGTALMRRTAPGQ